MTSPGILDVKRIQGLTDAVFAVAMTILILEIKVPPGLNDVVLFRYVRSQMLPELCFYFLSFVILGIFWIGSHFHHHIIAETDRMSSWLNILFLMLICVIPLSTKFIHNYRHDKISIIFYCINLIAASFSNLFMLTYAWKKNYIQPHIDRRQYTNAKQRILIPIYIYLGIITVAFFSTRTALYMFIIPVALHLFPEKINKKFSFRRNRPQQ